MKLADNIKQIFLRFTKYNDSLRFYISPFQKSTVLKIALSYNNYLHFPENIHAIFVQNSF